MMQDHETLTIQFPYRLGQRVIARAIWANPGVIIDRQWTERPGKEPLHQYLVALEGGRHCWYEEPYLVDDVVTPRRAVTPWPPEEEP